MRSDGCDSVVRRVKKNTDPNGVLRYRLLLARDIFKKQDVIKQNLDLMPGFSLRWYYSGMDLVMPDEKYINIDENIAFTRNTQFIITYCYVCTN